jgi:hypothetical protein
MITVGVKLNIKALDELATKLQKDIDNTLLKTAQAGIQIIEDRTERGRGYLGSFKPYAQSTVKSRQRRGRQTRFVDLYDTGGMMGNMTAFGGRGESRIRFPRQTEAEKAYYNNRTRPFFGFNSSEKRKLTRFFIRELA